MTRFTHQAFLSAVVLTLGVIGAFLARAEERTPPKGKASSPPPTLAWVLDNSGLKTPLSKVKLYREQLGFFNLTDVEISEFMFRLGRAKVLVPVRRVRSVTFKGTDENRSATIKSFFNESFEAQVEPEIKFTLKGLYEFAEFDINLKKVQSIEFEAPFVPVLFCESCKRFHVEPDWSFCPHDGTRLSQHSWSRVGSEMEKASVASGHKGPSFKGWKAEVESGITAYVTDDRGKKMEIFDAQLYRERLGLLSLSVEPTDTYVLKLGKGKINIELKKIKTMLIDRKIVELTDFEDRSFKADVDPEEKFFLQGRYQFARITIELADLHSITFLPPSSALRLCDSCHRIFSQEKWTHCAYDGAPLKR